MKGLICYLAALAIAFCFCLPCFAGVGYMVSPAPDPAMSVPAAPVPMHSACGPVGMMAMPQACNPVASMPMSAPCGPAIVGQSQTIVVASAPRVGLLGSIANGLATIKSHRDTRVVNRLEVRIKRHEHTAGACAPQATGACSPVGVMPQPACVGCGGGSE